MRVLLVDDDCNLVEAITIGFEMQWQEVEVLAALDGAIGWHLAVEEAPDVVLLDVNLPELNGWEVLKRVRQASDVPVIMLTARGEEMDRVRGLELGADDYIVKPFSHVELFARIRAVLRRAEMPPPLARTPSFKVGELAMDFASHQVTLRGQVVKLTPTEYQVLYQLVRNPNRVLSPERLLTSIWGEDYRNQSDYIKVYISRLRNKLEDEPENPRFITTERGLGYRFMVPERVGAVQHSDPGYLHAT